jgi:type III restriction enzyme
LAKPNSGGFELSFAAFLEAAPDVQAFAKNYFAVGFKLDYVKADGDLSNYVPDFIVRTADKTVWIVETKGSRGTRSAAENGAAQAMVRGCHRSRGAGATLASLPLCLCRSEGFEAHTPATFAALTTSFTEYQS